MSRTLLSLLLVLTTTTTALADQHFARPPGAPSTPQLDAEPRPAPRRDRAAIRSQLLANRLANLERFRAYQKAGVFPSNTYSSGLLNVWLDDAGHLCAAATIIRASGQTALVDQVARDNNFIKLADVTEGPVMDWILTSGLTQPEIVAIQKPFSGVGRPGRPIEIEPVIVVDPQLRANENARLAKLYRQIDAEIVRNQNASLELAVDRLMKQPALVATLLGG